MHQCTDVRYKERSKWCRGMIGESERAHLNAIELQPDARIPRPAHASTRSDSSMMMRATRAYIAASLSPSLAGSLPHFAWPTVCLSLISCAWFINMTCLEVCKYGIFYRHRTGREKATENKLSKSHPCCYTYFENHSDIQSNSNWILGLIEFLPFESS